MADDQIELDLASDMDTEVEVETPEVEASEVEISSDDQFQRADTATQKRIDRLTKKMREAERRENEAVNYAKKVQEESNGLKQRFQQLDNSYVQEYSTRVQNQMEQAEKELARAMEMGDTQAAVDANKRMISLSTETDRAAQAKVAQERQTQQQAQYVQQQQAPPPQQQQVRRPDPKAQDWAEKNEWFGQDDAKTFAAFGIHKRLVEDEGFDPTSNDYYNELDRRISDTFGGSPRAASKRAVQTVAGVSRNSSGRSGKKVRLTPSQVAIAKKLGVPLEAYAKYVKE